MAHGYQPGFRLLQHRPQTSASPSARTADIRIAFSGKTDHRHPHNSTTLVPPSSLAMSPPWTLLSVVGAETWLAAPRDEGARLGNGTQTTVGISLFISNGYISGKP